MKAMVALRELPAFASEMMRPGMTAALVKRHSLSQGPVEASNVEFIIRQPDNLLSVRGREVYLFHITKSAE